MDGKSGEVIWQKTLTREELLHYGRTNYPVGNAVYSQVIIDGGKSLYRDGKPFLPEGTHLETDPRYYGDNLLIRYEYLEGKVKGQDETRQTPVIDEYILVTPSGETIDVPNGDYLTGTSDFLLFKSRYDPPHDVYSYDLQSGESTLLYAEMDIYTAVTDGVWLYTNVPWSGRTDCWKLVFDDTGKLVALELIASDI